MNDGEGQAQGLDALVIETFPGHRSTEIAALGRRLRCRKGFRAFRILERFPIGQARALLLHIDRIPPLFLGLGAERSELFGLARGIRSLHSFTCRRVPIFDADRDVAIGETGGQARKIVAGGIFDRIAQLLENAAKDFGIDIDAGPIEQSDLDRIVGFDRLGGHGR